MATTVFNKPLDNEVASLNEQIGKIGTVVYGTNAQSLSVASRTYTNICSMTIPTGTWVIVGGHEWASSFSDLCICRLTANGGGLAGTLVRYAMDAGGGVNVATIYQATSSTTIALSVYQNSSEAKTASTVILTAVRIA